MKSTRRWLLAVIVLLVVAFGADAQKKKPAKKSTPQKSTVQKPKTQTPAQKPVAKPAEKSPTPSKENAPANASGNEQKVRDIVAFLEYMLNTLGSSETPVRDKTVLVTESYSKVFRDAKVQVEDDLDEERDVITNKDVVAYLKDVDFFFRDVKFEFTIDNIQQQAMAGGDRNKLFYKVSLRRNLKGTTSEGKPVNNTIPRYIEVNYSPDDQDLRIVSIYTNQIDEKGALENWWKELSYEWQAIFKRQLNVTSDSVSINDLKNITAIESLDLSNNEYIQTLDPLTALVNLRSLKLSGTSISDITPIRNLMELTELDVSHTRVQDLSPLNYSGKLTRLNIGHTMVSNISVVERMPALQSLEMEAVPVLDFAPVTNLTALQKLDLEGTRLSNLTPVAALVNVQELNVSRTAITDLSPLKGFKSLRMLTIDSTRVRNVSPLSSLDSLQVLSANYTQLSDLQPLQRITYLERVYCDQTLVNRRIADAFMMANPDVLVVFDSKDLKAWWDSLPSEWQEVFGKAANIGSAGPPAKEALAKITNIDSINVSGLYIRDLEPLRKLPQLEVIIAASTQIRDLLPLQDHRDIRYLDISETEVTDLTVVSQFSKLEVLLADKSKIEKIDPLFGILSLKELYVDNTVVHDIIARELLEKNPRCLIVHKTIHLNRWWRNLSADWKEVFRTQMGGDTTTNRVNLHKLVEREVLRFKDAPVNDLSALNEFVRLQELDFSGTAITTIPPLENILSLRSLHATHSPIQVLTSLTQFIALEDLDISNTPVDDLKGVGSLVSLKKLNCAGTQIKSLSALEPLQYLESLDCSNTNVNRLDPITSPRIKTLKCYNTKVTARRVEEFKGLHPECNVIYYR